MVRAIFSNTYDIENWHVSHISAAEFARLEALRGDATWVTVGEPDGGFYETYHGPAPAPKAE